MRRYFFWLIEIFWIGVVTFFSRRPNQNNYILLFNALLLKSGFWLIDSHKKYSNNPCPRSQRIGHGITQSDQDKVIYVCPQSAAMHIYNSLPSSSYEQPFVFVFFFCACRRWLCFFVFNFFLLATICITMSFCSSVYCLLISHKLPPINI